jgi:dTDP-4-dehydrorhamnose 3,5-epimerase
MKRKTKILDLILFENAIHRDFRGQFMEWINPEILLNIMKFEPAQINIVRSKKDVIRGLHTNTKMNMQMKFITCLEGKINDVALDLRSKSKTFGKLESFSLSAENGLSLLVPKGFAHGYSVISSEALVMYAVSEKYNPKTEIQINPLDPTLNIDWGIVQKPRMSVQDKKGFSFNEYLSIGDL